MKLNCCYLILSLGSAVAACSSTEQPLETSQGDRATSRVALTESMDAGDVPPTTHPVKGFRHLQANSRFLPGNGQVTFNEFGMQKTQGDQGVFAEHPTGMVLAVSNASADVRKKGPLPGGVAAHGEAVRAYFVSAGLPVDQIARVEPYPVMGRAFPNDEPLNTRGGGWNHKFTYSMIRRSIDGIPVPDSFAWARLNQDGGVVCESVYWPDIPATVVAEAKTLSARLANPANGDSLQAIFRSGIVGQINIRHTPGHWHQAFRAIASYDVPDEVDWRRPLRHFGLDGVQRDLPNEVLGAWGPTPVTSRAK